MKSINLSTPAKTQLGTNKRVPQKKKKKEKKRKKERMKSQTRFLPYSKANIATSVVCPARRAIALQLFEIKDAVL
jgi:hypothetical protein